MSRDEEASHVVPARGEVSVHEDGQRCFRFADILLVLPGAAGCATSAEW